MNESSIGVAPAVRASERVVVHVNSPAARWIGALVLFSAACWLITAIARGHDQAGWHATGRLEWSLTVLAAVALVARGIFLGRPVTARHATAAAHRLVRRDRRARAVFRSARRRADRGVRPGADVAHIRATTARRPVSGVGIDQRHQRRPAGAVRHAGGQVLPVQRGRHGGARLPDAHRLRGGQRGPCR